MRRHCLTDERVRNRPFATDTEAGDRARNQQRPETDRESREQCADAVDQDREHQQRLATVLVAKRAAEQAADGGEREPDPEDERDVRIGQPEIALERRCRDNVSEQEQIVEIEDPPDEREGEDLPVNRQDRGAFAQQGHSEAMLR